MYFNPSIPIYTIMRLARFKGDLYFPIFKHESSRTTALIQKELPPSMSASKTPGPNLEINNSRKYTNRCYFDVLQYSQGLVYRSTASVDHEDGEGGLFLAKARIQLRRSRSSAYTTPRPFLAVIVLRIDELAERAALIQRPKSIGRILTSVNYIRYRSHRKRNPQTTIEEAAASFKLGNCDSRRNVSCEP